MELNLNPNLTYAFAVSGGVDSMLLLHLAAQKGLKGVVVTVDHNLRTDSADDAAFVARTAKALGYETIIKKVDVEGTRLQSGESVELCARRLRYEVFSDVLNKGLADCVVLAHHLDDQCETLAMRIFRGTGTLGLAGMGERAGFVRPFLRVTRAEISALAVSMGIEYREDDTNADDAYRRNYIRHEVLPTIEKAYPAYRQSLLTLSQNAAETEDFLETLLIKPSENDTRVAFDISLLDAHPALWKRSLRRALYRYGIEKDVERQTYAAIATLKDKPSNTFIDIGQGLRAGVVYGKLIIERDAPTRSFCEPFAVDKVYRFGGKEYTFCRGTVLVAGRSFDASKLPTDTVVRTRRVGDIFKRYKGGTKPLAEYLSDIKLPPETRNSVLCLASNDTVFAVLGVEVADCVAVGADSDVTVVTVTEC